jgi:hypothetical protein
MPETSSGFRVYDLAAGGVIVRLRIHACDKT